MDWGIGKGEQQYSNKLIVENKKYNTVSRRIEKEIGKQEMKGERVQKEGELEVMDDWQSKKNTGKAGWTSWSILHEIGLNGSEQEMKHWCIYLVSICM